jgi:hypothetical protein
MLRSEQVKKLSKFFILFFLIFNFKIFSYSEDINQIELDGMSLDDSLLNFTSKKEIKKNILQYFEDERDYYIVFFDKNLSQYDDFEIYLKTNDNSYKVKGINAGIYPKSLKECLNTMEEISKDISSTLGVTLTDDNGMHNFYKNSFINGKTGKLDGGYINIDCMFFDDKDKKKYPNLVDNLAVMIKSDEIEKWFQSGYK